MPPRRLLQKREQTFPDSLIAKQVRVALALWGTFLVWLKVTARGTRQWQRLALSFQADVV